MKQIGTTEFHFELEEVREALVDYLQKLNPEVGLPPYEKFNIETYEDMTTLIVKR